MRTHYRGRILIQASLKVEREEARKLKLNPDELSTGQSSDRSRSSIASKSLRVRGLSQVSGTGLEPARSGEADSLKGKLGFIRIPARLLKGARFRAP